MWVFEQVGKFATAEDGFELCTADCKFEGLELCDSNELGSGVWTSFCEEDAFKLGFSVSHFDGVGDDIGDGIGLGVKLGSMVLISVGMEDGAGWHRSDAYSRFPMLEQFPLGKKPRSFQVPRPLLA
mmetsp:Transcript_28193/g.42653  ORF Transcript_28193/g.42653 Transcript_28193/m.42653 type:complete len:126 (+) Transcript_28193:336-713(+)